MWTGLLWGPVLALVALLIDAWWRITRDAPTAPSASAGWTAPTHETLLGAWGTAGSVLGVIAAVVIFAAGVLRVEGSALNPFEAMQRSGLLAVAFLAFGCLLGSGLLILGPQAFVGPLSSWTATVQIFLVILLAALILVGGIRATGAEQQQGQRTRDALELASAYLRRALVTAASREWLTRQTWFQRRGAFGRGPWGPAILVPKQIRAHRWVLDVDLRSLRDTLASSQETQYLVAAPGELVEIEEGLLRRGLGRTKNLPVRAALSSDARDVRMLQLLLKDTNDALISATQRGSQAACEIVVEPLEQMISTWALAEELPRLGWEDFTALRTSVWALVPKEDVMQVLTTGLERSVATDFWGGVVACSDPVFGAEIGAASRGRAEVLGTMQMQFVYWAGRFASAHTDSANYLVDRASRGPLEILSFFVGSQIRDAGRRDAAFECARTCHATLGELMRALVQAERHDEAREVDRKWGRTLANADHGEDRASLAWELTNSTDSDDRRALADKVASLETLDAILDDRARSRLDSLAYAVFHGADPRFVTQLARQYPSAESAVRLALSSSGARRPALSRWMLSDLPTGEVHVIGDDQARIRAAARVVAVGWRGPSQLELEDVPSDQTVQALVGEVESLLEADQAVGELWPDERIRQLRDWLAVAVTDAKHHQNLRAANSPLDSTRVEAFTTAVQSAWESSSSLSFLRDEFGLRFADPEEGDPYLTSSSILDRRGFIDDPSFMSSEELGQEFSRQVARTLDDRLLAVAASTCKKERVGGGLVDRLDLLHAAAATEGIRATALIVPPNWRIIAELRHDQGTRGPGRRMGGFVGITEWRGLHVLRGTRNSTDRLSLVDLAGAIRLRLPTTEGIPDLPESGIRELTDGEVADYADARTAPGDGAEVRERLEAQARAAVVGFVRLQSFVGAREGLHGVSCTLPPGYAELE